LAGFLAGFLEGEDYQKAFDMALAAGTACAYKEGLPEGKDIYAMYKSSI
jgi:fructose-1-phosphate kinase PfkB-like protein